MTPCFRDAGVLSERCEPDGGWSEIPFCDFSSRARLVADLLPGDAGSAPSELARVGAHVCFTAAGQIWCSDGSTAGTVRISNLNANASLGASFPISNGTQMIYSEYANGHRGLYLTDGTLAGSTAINPTLSVWGPGAWLDDGGFVFGSYAAATGVEPWFTNSSGTTTRLIKDLSPGMGNTLTQFFTSVGSHVLFADQMGQVYVTDGRDAGLVPAGVANGSKAIVAAGAVGYSIYTGAGGTSASRIDPVSGSVNSVMLSTATAGLRTAAALGDQVLICSGNSLFLTDGRDAGITFDLGSANCNWVAVQGNLAVISTGNAMYAFPSADGGLALLESFGQNGGVALAPCAGGVCFSGGRPLSGTGAELWWTDGTQAGTYQLLDLFPGVGSSSPRWVTQLGNVLLFAAQDGVHGVELWALDLP